MILCLDASRDHDLQGRDCHPREPLDLLCA